MNPIVTVYITNYNYGRYLDKAIKSVLNQSYQNFELIIIDDGSTDHSKDIIIGYEKLPNVFVIHQNNKGLNIANNIALNQANGKYIIRLDADDYFDHRALEIMVTTLDKDSDLALVFPDYYEIDDDDNIITQVKRHDFENDVTLFDQPAHGACTMIRRKFLLEIGGYDETFNRQDGYDLWLSIIDNYHVKNINLPLFNYRRHSSNLTNDEELLLKTRAQIIAKHAAKKTKNELTSIAIIPVRGSSMDPHSVPLKNLGEKPLIDWTLDSALDSSFLKHVVLTTPDYDVFEHVTEKYGDDVIKHERNIELARINTKLPETVINSLKFYCDSQKKPDNVVVLNIEAPFRTAMYIDKAIHLMKIYDIHSVIGVRKDDDIFYIHDGSGLKPRTKNNFLRLERDDLFRKVGGMTLVSVDYLLKEKKLRGGKIGHVQFDQKAAFQIKSKLDWEMAYSLITETRSF